MTLTENGKRVSDSIDFVANGNEIDVMGTVASNIFETEVLKKTSLRMCVKVAGCPNSSARTSYRNDAVDKSKTRNEEIT